MRHTRLGIITAFALILAILAPASAFAAPLGPKSDVAVGGGKTWSDIFNISAHVNPNGKVMGHINASNVPDYPAFVVEGDLTCLNVVGNRASMGGTLTKLEGVTNPEQYHGWLFFVEDNGNQQDVPDKISYQYIYANPITTCPNPGPSSAFFDLLEGNIVVIKGQ